MRHVRRVRKARESNPDADVVNTLGVRLCLFGTVFAALSVALEGYAWERRQIGAFAYLAIRDELDAAFFRWVLFAADVTSHVLVVFLAPAFLGGIVSGLVAGFRDRSQALAYTATLVTTTAVGVSVVVTETYVHPASDIPWLIIAVGTVGGLLANVGGAGGRSGADSSQVDTPPGPGPAEPASRARQSPARGRVLTVLGWALRVLTLVMLLLAGPLYEELVTESDLPLWARPVAAFAAVAPVLLFGVADALAERGRRHRHRVIPAFEELAGERYLLYLRPFSVDPAMALPLDEAPGWATRSPFELSGTHEEFLVRQFRGLGRIVAVGQPGERLPALGAERGYLPGENWQDPVSRLIQGAQAVIMTAAPGAGTAWEFTEALRVIAPARLLLIVYHDEIYHAFREGVSREYATRSSVETDVSWPPLPQLPDIPPPAADTGGLRWDFPVKGILSFDHRWRPQFTRFPPAVPRIRHVWTIRRLVRRELRPVLDRVSRLPPAPPPG
ncbi:hypothetical protein [Micromonospora echinofusca]|uniref:Uncharacterized protein n=1 Tax=Micromonospora echinofusca TaxID=47858 RepID=A0ABS3VSI4_MICEH|nr:hypothetical protein [Micromonospora echinofusca]MBO4207473.1 hypothetical protein [Micromonospora echinofusca]